MARNYPYLYSEQMRKLMIQFMRIFSGFRVKTGMNAQGYQEFIAVPVVYGDGSRQAQQILRSNSENAIMSTPRISVMIQSVAYDINRSSYAGLEEDLLVTERHYDVATQSYTSAPGHGYHVTRLQPTPINVGFRVDVWTSNMDQKLQLFEQIMLLFNPSLDIQTSSSILDWTALQTITLDEILWNDQGSPERGTNDDIHVHGFNFTAQSWIAPPSKVQKQQLINTVIQRLGDVITSAGAGWSDAGIPTYNITTPQNHVISVAGTNITLLGAYGQLTDAQGHVYSWPKLLDEYGELEPNYSKLALRWHADVGDASQDILGFIALDPAADNILTWNVIDSTLPAANLLPINGFIDAHVSVPGGALPAAAAGQRYVMTTNIAGPVAAWPGLNTASVGDIIEYSSGAWFTVFVAAAQPQQVIIQNYSVVVTGTTVTLINACGKTLSHGAWANLLAPYGGLRPGAQLQLTWQDTSTQQTVSGLVTINATDKSQLSFVLTTNTSSLETQDPVLGVIDPTVVYPGAGLAPAAAGQRYIITVQLLNPINTWPGIVQAGAGDVIEYFDNAWSVAFAAGN